MLEWCFHQGIYKLEVTEHNLPEKSIKEHFELKRNYLGWILLLNLLIPKETCAETQHTEQLIYMN